MRSTVKRGLQTGPLSTNAIRTLSLIMLSEFRVAVTLVLFVPQKRMENDIKPSSLPGSKRCNMGTSSASHCIADRCLMLDLEGEGQRIA